MTLETGITAAAHWLWDQYGKILIHKATLEVSGQWSRFRWKDAEARYRNHLRKLYSTTRLLGNPKPIEIEDIFTDVYVLNNVTALRRYELRNLQSRPLNREDLQLEDARRPALRLAVTGKRWYILGKPGSGKTTFLKYITLQACLGKLPETPIFVSLKEWDDSGLDLLPFIVQQLEVCAFPDAESFILQLLKNGKARILFDGLDEVNQEGNRRSQMIRTLNKFAKQYPDIHIIVTCRIAAIDYYFDQFTYLELSDFDEKQIKVFVGKWYQSNKQKHATFLKEFHKPEHQSLRELARTPLLLTLLCLAFDETLSFPIRRVDLYKEALDALLKKWDSSRGIRRDQIYRHLSPIRKEQMLARIAAQNFENGDYFIIKTALVKQISTYLSQLPNTDAENPPDGELVLEVMEAQHGILVERAFNIFSFSHLTFQEYFTARYIVENAAGGTLSRLIEKHITHDHWREIFLLTISLLDEGNTFFELYTEKLNKMIKDKACMELFRWAKEKAQQSRWPDTSGRVVFFFIALTLALSRTLIQEDKELTRDFAPVLDRARTLAHDYLIAHSNKNSRQVNTILRALEHTRYRIMASSLGIDLNDIDLKQEWNIDRSHLEHIKNYLWASQLMLECLQLATLSNRQMYETRLFMLLSLAD